jgi:hypothetical protein
MTPFTAEELKLLKVLRDPVLWAKLTFNWTARDYQVPILRAIPDTKLLVLRLGRRLGKTECMCLAILWYAFAQPNKGPNNQYDILIITPFESQIDLIFDRLHELISLSPDYKNSIRRDITHRIELKNGAAIQGMTAGSKNNTGAANTRGQRADVIVLDEVDYMLDDDITNIINIRNEDPKRIRIIAASTPSGARSKYYEWCTRASRDYRAITDANGVGFVKYELTERPGRQGNGWTHFYAPSIVNKNILDINPDTGQTYLDDIKDELTEMRYLQEVMAEFGEEQLGVFQKKHLDAAREFGRQLGVTYTLEDFPRQGPRILAVDWDKYGASTNMVGMELNEQKHAIIPFVRREIPRGEFTFDNAVQEIIRLNEIFNFDWIYVDSGYGEYQIETLRKYGMRNPQSGLQHKVVRVNFSEKLTVRDPITKKAEKKEIKPFMINETVKAFERGHIALNPDDKKMIKQLEDYQIKKIGQNGKPIYVETNEHIVDCVCMCVMGFTLKYTDMMKVQFASRMYGVNRNFTEPESEAVKPRTIEPVEQTDVYKIGPTMVAVKPLGRRRSGMRGIGGMPSRSRF